MSEQTSLISAQNMQTIVAVCFVLALLSVAFNFYNFTRINQVYGVTAAVHNTSVRSDNTLADKLNRLQQAEQDIADLQGKMGKLEKKVAKMKAAPADGEGEGKAKGKGKGKN